MLALNMLGTTNAATLLSLDQAVPCVNSLRLIRLPAVFQIVKVRLLLTWHCHAIAVTHPTPVIPGVMSIGAADAPFHTTAVTHPTPVGPGVVSISAQHQSADMHPPAIAMTHLSFRVCY